MPEVLHDMALPAPVYVYADLCSTLDVVHTLAKEHSLPPWTSIVARSQSGGRGQLRRQWESPVGNVYAALCLPCVQPFSTSACAPAVGFLVVQALRRMGLEVCLKWPNDIVLWHGQKAYKVGGILVEEHQHGIWAGIGINILHSPPESRLRPAYALPASHLSALLPSHTCSEEFHNIIKFWLHLVKEAFSCYETRVLAHDSWCEAASELLLWRGSMVNLYDDPLHIYARLAGIGPSGGVCLERHGVVEEFFSGSLRLC
ncbi:MAG: biotin--[acetyl-CoA-carboxylase] ligase [Desulfovibrionaceae bacterium]